MVGGGYLGSDSSDSGGAGGESDDSTTQESNAYLNGSDAAGPIIGGGGEDAAPAGAEIFDPFDDSGRRNRSTRLRQTPWKPSRGAAAQVKHAHDLATGDAAALAAALLPSKALHKVLEC